MPRIVLVVYDISDDDIRSELREIIKDFGGEKLQFSVYQLYISKKQFLQLKSALLQLLNKTNGTIHFLFPCNNCLRKIIHISNRF